MPKRREELRTYLEGNLKRLSGEHSREWYFLELHYSPGFPEFKKENFFPSKKELNKYLDDYLSDLWRKVNPPLENPFIIQIPSSYDPNNEREVINKMTKGCPYYDKYVFDMLRKENEKELRLLYNFRRNPPPKSKGWNIPFGLKAEGT